MDFCEVRVVCVLVDDARVCRCLGSWCLCIFL